MEYVAMEKGRCMIGAFVFFLILFWAGSGLGLFTEEKVKAVIRVDSDFQLTRIKQGFYVHTTWFEFPGFGRYPSNGLVFIKNNKALLVDTPVTEKQTKQLYTYLKESMDTRVTKLIISHYHDDCLGGLGYLQGLGIPSISSGLTRQECRKRGLPLTAKGFENKLTMTFEGQEVICRYFGSGHTVDNIVVFFPDRKVLFGGCLVKSLESSSLGNTKDAVVKEWGATLKKIMAAYIEIDVVVPGHGAYGNSALLIHTVRLVNTNSR